MGWLRNLFGGTVNSEYREDGKRAKKTVSKAQFDSLVKKAVAEGKATLHGACVVHILDPMHDGPRIESWIIGEQVSRETYDRLKHSNGELYVIVYYERGEATIQVLKKESWDLAVNKLAAISREGEQATKIG
jgi:hypothetical protein